MELTEQEEGGGQGTDREPSSETLEVLSDSRSRSILVEMRRQKDTLTAKEVSENCEIPLSTVYRKLDALLGAGLIRELMELRKGCTHTHTYELRFEDIEVSVTEEGMKAEITRPREREKTVGQRFS
jgi:Fe2+ or Zn2+ uptake regulation protein